MADLYQINEIIQTELDDKLKLNHFNDGYSSDTNYLSTINLFIKGIQKALDSVNRAAEIINLTNQQAGSELMAEFSSNLELAKQIVEEFQKGTAILYDNTPELVNLFNQLNDAFTIVKLKICMFTLTKEIKYSVDTVQYLNSVLGVFQTMKNVTQENLRLSQDPSGNSA